MNDQVTKNTRSSNPFDVVQNFNSDIRRDVNAPLVFPGVNAYNDNCIIKGVTSDDIELLFTNGLGGLTTSATRAMWGFNHSGPGYALPTNYDQHGYTFFTKPRLRLNDGNCVLDRSLMYLLNKDPLSIPIAVRNFLDPIGGGAKIAGVSPKITRTIKKPFRSPLVDPKSPFITILSNSLLSLTGWPDIAIDTYTSPSGPLKEKWSMYDGFSKYYDEFDLNATFKNMRGDPIGLLFHSWITYGSLVMRNERAIPYYDSIIDQEKDYETRIYRLVMDQTKTYVQKIACTGASFPTATNIGSVFDYNVNEPVSDKLDNHSISFKCQGAMYYDYYIAVAFNMTVVDFNQYMFPKYRKDHMTKITFSHRPFFRDEGYPWINLDTGELEWYVFNSRFKQVMERINNVEKRFQQSFARANPGA